MYFDADAPDFTQTCLGAVQAGGFSSDMLNLTSRGRVHCKRHLPTIERAHLKAAS